MKHSLALCYLGLCCFGLAACTAKSTSPTNTADVAERDVVPVDASTQTQLGLHIEPAAADSVTPAITANGELQLNEDRTWKVGAMTEGRVVSVPVHLGETVRAGQVVIEMHGHEVHEARANRRQALAELESRQVLAEQALRVRDRTRRLFDLKAASKEQLEAAGTQYRTAVIGVENAQTEVRKVEAHLTEFLDVSVHDPNDAAESGEIEDLVPIKAPAAGTVMERLVSAGSVVLAGSPVMTVSDLSSLWLIAAVNEADLSYIRRGQQASISVRAYPDKTFPGTVAQLGERLDPQTRTLQVRVLLSNRNGLLKPDMFASVEFTPEPQKRMIHVPEAAIQELGGKPVVFVRRADKSFAAAEVKTGRKVAGQVEILSGLEPGAPVVSDGALLLKSQLLKIAGD